MFAWVEAFRPAPPSRLTGRGDFIDVGRVEGAECRRSYPSRVNRSPTREQHCGTGRTVASPMDLISHQVASPVVSAGVERFPDVERV
mmetsp:Transcript_11972/g.21020  ORF Transcript_11972/g.21020 Transcript_11972/m.21020 type:complete len:87 (-) Transcript_11972:135-395(-)